MEYAQLVLVEKQDGTLKFVKDERALSALVSELDTRGLRENELQANLQAHLE